MVDVLVAVEVGVKTEVTVDVVVAIEVGVRMERTVMVRLE